MNQTTDRLTVGVDLGGTNLRIGLVDYSGAVIEVHEQSSIGTADELIEIIVQKINAWGSNNAIQSVGVGVAGMIDYEGVVHYAPNLPEFTGVPLQPRLAQRLDYPVAVDNDANTAAWGEVNHGAAQGHDAALVITLGTGIGGGVIVGGQIYRGAHGFAAEVGHWQFDPAGPLCACGGRGHWEAMASGSALDRMAQEQAAAGNAPALLALVDGDARSLTGHHVVQALAASDEVAQSIWNQFTRAVGIGLAGLINLFDPSVVVISGGLVVLGEVLLNPIASVVAEEIEGSQYRSEVQILPAVLGDQAGLVGAAAMARDLVP
ncbi:MAG: ROK family protein [Acidimicrobiia bacterium]|nr:ROK family protein [Acidimicrobiia bacterium]